MTLGKSGSNRSLPVDATTTRVYATPEVPSPSGKKKSLSERPGKINEEGPADKPAMKDDQRPEKVNQVDSTSKSMPEIPEDPAAPSPPVPESQNGWLSWLPRRDGSISKPPDPQALAQNKSPESESHPPPADNVTIEGVKTQPDADDQAKQRTATVTSKRSWYQMWGSDATSETMKKQELLSEPPRPGTSNPTERPEVPKQTSKNVDIPSKDAGKVLEVPPSGTPKTKSASQASSLETSAPPTLPGDGSKSSGWVFWSRDKKGPSSTKSETDPHVGEIAISDTPSQVRPKRASISLQDESARPMLKPSQQEDQSKKPDVAQKVVETKPPATEPAQTVKATKKAPSKSSGATTKAESSGATALAREPARVSTPRATSPTPSKKEDANLLLPSLQDTLSAETQPSLLQQIARLLYYTKEPELRHLSLIKDPPRIKNALALGVHGYFPGPMVRSLIGQPTGTSIKFADKAAQNIKNWTKRNNYECEVKSAALEGEGRIGERVELLWKLLLNWIDEIRKSDFVMIACHSQGVPVAIMLVAKLIQFGCLSGARVGICAMAGVNMGPFQEYKSPWITGSAGELFEFTDPNSKVSMDYAAAMEVVLKFGVKLTFVGSIDDQLVSMESAIYAPITHPHIYRAVSIDSRVHAPNFLSHLVGFALKLRNVGVPDHGLIRELSAPLAGSLYTGEGHSRLYEDDSVYDLAISFALQTSALPDIAISRRPTSSSGANPYILPFAMRGILEEDYVRKELQHEAQELLAQFDDWKPTTKALKDVKFRLEGIRSKL